MDENGAVELVSWFWSMKLVPLHYSVSGKFVQQWSIHVWFL